MSDKSERTGGAVFPRRTAGPGSTLTRHIARVSAVFDAAPIGVGVWSVDGVLLHANPVLCDLVGREQQDLVGEVFDAFINRADAEGIQQLVEEMWDGRRNYFECDFRCRRPSGADLWLRSHLFAVYGAGGRPEYLISQILSFVDRRTNESSELRLASESPAILWLSDSSGIPRTGNGRAFEFLGLPAGSGELLGALFETVHPEDYARSRDELRRRIDAHEPFEFTARSRRADGQWRWLHHRARPVFSGDDGFEGYAGASLDVTDDERRRLELEDVRRLFETVTEAGPLAMLRTDVVGRVMYANGRWASLIDDPGMRLTGLGWRGVLIPEHVEEVVRRSARAVETKQPFALRVRAHDASIPADRSEEGFEGRYWAELRVAPVFTLEGVHDGFVATIADVTAEVAAGERADQLARVLDAGTDFLMIVERNGAITYGNQAAEEGLGLFTNKGDEPQFLMDVLDPDSFSFFHEVVEPVLHEVNRWKGELTMRDHEGRDVPVSALVLAHTNDLGRIETISVVARDISDLKQAQWQMRQLATHDYLTGLPNRMMLYDRLDQALARFHRLGQTVALLYLDLDRFKPINDELGHHVGDAVLVTLADRIHATVRDIDTPARIGGDEFCVLIEGFDSPELLEGVASRLIEAISEPIAVEGVSVAVGVSIGIVSADQTSTDADSLLARGDAAMYRAKAAGRGRFVIAEAGTLAPSSAEPDHEAPPVAAPGGADPPDGPLAPDQT
jgi:diguanylate cyclase (GGDEF)-like protein/PAS domain S-box-containing protein